MLLDMFLKISVSVQMCHSVTGATVLTFPLSIVFTKALIAINTQWLFAHVFVEINVLVKTIDTTKVVV